MTRLRIVSDGTALGTQVYDPDGRLIDWVSKVEWSCDANGTGVASALLTVDLVEVDVVGDGLLPLVEQTD